MAKEPTGTGSGTAAAKTDSVQFRTAFKQDPVAALRGKGIVLSSAEATKLADQVKQLKPGRGQAGDLEAVKVSVGIEI